MKFWIVLAAAVLGTFAAIVATDPWQSASADLGGDQADSVNFQLGFAPGNQGDPEGAIGHVVYCGVGAGAEPFVLDVAVRNRRFTVAAPAGSIPEDERSGWLSVRLHGRDLILPGGSPERFEYDVRSNSSFSFTLTLGGRPNVDQLVQISTPPLGDEFGGNAPFLGIASVRARQTAADPFNGDGRRDNFCTSIGLPGEVAGAEFLEGQISTRLPVPDGWVIDGNGADGGVLRGFPH